MGLKEWADRQERKADTRAAIEETHFQMGTFQVVAATLRVIESDKEAVQRFDLSEYLSALIAGLRESEARLYGYKGDPATWLGSREIIKAQQVHWTEGRRERGILADVLRDLRVRLTTTLADFNAGQTPEETRVALKSEIDSFLANVISHAEHGLDEALADGLINQDQLVKVKRRAETRVGKIVRSASS